jgi:hypothetical protein
VGSGVTMSKPGSLRHTKSGDDMDCHVPSDECARKWSRLRFCC